MSQKLSIKPPGPTRYLLMGQIIIVSLFLPFGLGLVWLAEGEARPFALLFGLIWVAGCLTIMIHAIKTRKLLKAGKIEIAEITGSQAEMEGGFAQRIRALEGLKKEGLLSDDEYRKKRTEIMREKW